MQSGFLRRVGALALDGWKLSLSASKLRGYFTATVTVRHWTGVTVKTSCSGACYDDTVDRAVNIALATAESALS